MLNGNLSGFFNMSERDMILASGAIAGALCEGLNSDEQSTLANFLLCVAQNISSAAGQKALREKNKENK